jgi:hypothetical protein
MREPMTLLIPQPVNCGDKHGDIIPAGLYAATWRARCADDANGRAVDGYALAGIGHHGHGTIDEYVLRRYLHRGQVQRITSAVESNADAEGEILMQIQRERRR